MLQGLIKEIDMHSIHFYSNLGFAKAGRKGDEYEVNVFSPNVSRLKSVELEKC